MVDARDRRSQHSGIEWYTFTHLSASSSFHRSASVYLETSDLLEPYEIAFSDRIYEGNFKIGEHETYFGSGASIGKFPASNKNYLVYKELNDQAEEFIADAANTSLPSARVTKTELVPILGLAQINPDEKIPGTDELKAGRMAVYGDSSCLDSSHMDKGKHSSSHCPHAARSFNMSSSFQTATGSCRP